MKSHITVSDVIELSIPERIQFVEDVWDSIRNVPDAVELSNEEKKILDQRLKSYHESPETGSPWEVVKDRIREKK